ncbi:carboxymuconolactone decarboxylase family protein [Actinoplanes sp. NPDC051411]|uniref:carboxymuconolactone decarboxylase family protein n=1 Tax=Actinoplanes sp. NPDC051411 TaxID=3155522 RepID=UPI00343A1E4D
MTGFTPVDPATATGPAAEVLAETKKAMGSTPNMAKVMAINPAVLKGYLALSGALGGGVLPPAVRERLAIATAEYNRCEYCLSAHTFIGGRVAKLDDAELALARDGKSGDQHAAALLALSDAIMRGRGTVDDAVLEAARGAGVSDAEIAEVIAHIALNVLTNYFNILTGVDNDFPVVTPHAHAA